MMALTAVGDSNQII